jgi:hypothetical protein
MVKKSPTSNKKKEKKESRDLFSLKMPKQTTQMHRSAQESLTHMYNQIIEVVNHIGSN